jgi:putative transposase
MSLPRAIIPERRYLITRRCSERREQGIKLLGSKAVLRQHWSDSPSTREPRRGLSPRVACRNKWARIEALQRNRAFLDQYRGARADHLAGHAAVFPPGTWWLCRFAGLTCAEFGATVPPS